MHRYLKIGNEQLIDQLKRFFLVIKKSERIESSEIQNSWKEVEKLIDDGHDLDDCNNKVETTSHRKKGNLSFYFTAISIAAMVLLFVMLPWQNWRMMHEPSVLSILQNSSITSDSIKQISLFLSNKNQVQIENESVVHYDREGNVIVDSGKKKTAQSLNNGGSESTHENLNQIVVPRGKRMHLMLSDGTMMYVNSESRVIYPARFKGNKREIAVEGEIYLEVARNEKAPFVVKTVGCDIQVLGTVLNVSAYKNSNISVVLVKGRVEVKAAHEKSILNPSQLLTLESGVMTTKAVNVAKYICWKDDMMLLQNDRVSKILDDLSRYYGVPVWYDKNVQKLVLSGKLDLGESTDAVFDIVKESASLKMNKLEGGGYYFSSK